MWVCEERCIVAGGNALVRVRRTRTVAGAYPVKLMVMAMAKVMMERYPSVGEILTQLICLLQGASDPLLRGHMNDKRMNEMDARTLGVESVPNDSLLSRQAATGAYLWDKVGERTVCQAEGRGLDVPDRT